MTLPEKFNIICRYGTLPRKRFHQDYEYVKAHNPHVRLITDPVISLSFDCEEYEWWKTDIDLDPAATLAPFIEGDFKN